MKKITLTTYRKDKYYPRVVRAVSKILSTSDSVTPVNILIEMGNLSQKIMMPGGKEKYPILNTL